MLCVYAPYLIPPMIFHNENLKALSLLRLREINRIIIKQIQQIYSFHLIIS